MLKLVTKWNNGVNSDNCDIYFLTIFLKKKFLCFEKLFLINYLKLNEILAFDKLISLSCNSW